MEEKSLQKLTEIEVITNELLAQEKITLEDVRDKLPKGERTNFITHAYKIFNSLTGVKKDEFSVKIEDLITKEVRNKLWEYNHNQITCAISNLMQEIGRMPTATEIAYKAELSRQTVHKHLKEYASNPVYIDMIEQFRFMNSKVLTKVFQFAVNGDVAAAKLYLNVVGNLGNSTFGGTINNTQNNFIQINQFKLSQDIVKQLSPEQLTQIETIVKDVVIAKT